MFLLLLYLRIKNLVINPRKVLLIMEYAYLLSQMICLQVIIFIRNVNEGQPLLNVDLLRFNHMLLTDIILKSSMGLVFWNSIHLEVASDSFCFLINSSWLLVFILYVFFMIFSGFNLYCWKGIHFS
jgi:hypothetical protein